MSLNQILDHDKPAAVWTKLRVHSIETTIPIDINGEKQVGTLDMYINVATGSDDNDGLTISTPVQTWEGFYNQANKHSWVALELFIEGAVNLDTTSTLDFTELGYNYSVVRLTSTRADVIEVVNFAGTSVPTPPYSNTTVLGGFVGLTPSLYVGGVIDRSGTRWSIIDNTAIDITICGTGTLIGQDFSIFNTGSTSLNINTACDLRSLISVEFKDLRITQSGNFIIKNKTGGTIFVGSSRVIVSNNFGGLFRGDFGFTATSFTPSAGGTIMDTFLPGVSSFTNSFIECDVLVSDKIEMNNCVISDSKIDINECICAKLLNMTFDNPTSALGTIKSGAQVELNNAQISANGAGFKFINSTVIANNIDASVGVSTADSIFSFEQSTGDFSGQLLITNPDNDGLGIEAFNASHIAITDTTTVAIVCAGTNGVCLDILSQSTLLIGAPGTSLALTSDLSNIIIDRQSKLEMPAAANVTLSSADDAVLLVDMSDLYTPETHPNTGAGANAVKVGNNAAIAVMVTSEDNTTQYCRCVVRP